MAMEHILKKAHESVQSGWPLGRMLAHRGGGSLAPENTLVALDVAARFACGVEFDVMLSADGTLVVIHDDTLDRTTNGSGLVADCRDADLLALDAGSWHGPDFVGQGVPTAEAFVMRCAQLGLPMNIEIKPSAGADVATGQALADLLATVKFQLPPVLVSSFSEYALQAYAAHGGAAPTGLLVETVPPDWSRRCQALGVAALHARSVGLEAASVASVKAAGLWLAVYTENVPARASQLWAWGVDCVITDRPDVLSSAGA